MPEIRDRLLAQGQTPMPTTGDVYRQLMVDEGRKWGAVIKRRNVRLDRGARSRYTEADFDRLTDRLTAPMMHLTRPTLRSAIPALPVASAQASASKSKKRRFR